MTAAQRIYIVGHGTEVRLIRIGPCGSFFDQRQSGNTGRIGDGSGAWYFC